MYHIPNVIWCYRRLKTKHEENSQTVTFKYSKLESPVSTQYTYKRQNKCWEATELIITTPNKEETKQSHRPVSIIALNIFYHHIILLTYYFASPEQNYHLKKDVKLNY